ncbi:MAG TPA: hypothetical protein VLV78_02950 [Thermoanaerobaculia bacterium]|nr:hypothetical protein [Thermoanaerobaculia bacterium]
MSCGSGSGAGHLILRNIDKRAGARDTPIATRSRVTFAGTDRAARIDVKPLVISTGIAFPF